MKQSFPDFLVIGAQKAGTSWLHSVLSAQSSVWLPPLKEIHYFDRKFPVKNPAQQSKVLSAVKPDRGIKQRLRRFNIPKLFKYLSELNLNRLMWEFRYYTGKRDDKWYAGLFDQAGKRLKGDITPAYSRLDDDAVQYVHQLMPKSKIIFLLRNPIDRAWSHAVMDLAKFQQRSIADVSDDEFLTHFKSTASVLRGSYSVTINTWRKYYPEDQFFIGYFDDVGKAPDKLLTGVMDFLGMPPVNSLSDLLLRKKVNTGKSVVMPEKFRQVLAQQYEPELELLVELCGGRTSQWLEEARSL